MKSFFQRCMRVLILVLAFMFTMAGCSFQMTACSFQSGNRGLMSGETSTAKTDTIKKEYSCKEGDTVNFNYDSIVKEGSLSMKFVDSTGKAIETFETGKAGNREIKIARSDNYTVIVELEGFKGSYKLEMKSK